MDVLIPVKLKSKPNLKPYISLFMFNPDEMIFPKFHGLICLLFLTQLFPGEAFCQWQKLTSFPDENSIYDILVKDNSIFVATSGQALMISRDNGATWNSILLNQENFARFIRSFDDVLYFNTANYLYYSTDQGFSWLELTTDVKLSVDFLIHNSVIYAPTVYDGMMISNDMGQTWQQSTQGFSSSPAIESVEALNDRVFAASRTGIYMTENNGVSWESVNTGLTTTEMTNLTNLNGKLYAGGRLCGIFEFDETQFRWNKIMSIPDITTWSMQSSGTIALISSAHGLFRSKGSDWEENTSIPHDNIFASYELPDGYYSCPYQEGIWQYTYGVGIEESHSEGAEIKVYPTVFTDFITIEYETEHIRPIRLSISDIQGKLIESIAISMTKTEQLNFSHLPAGWYHLAIKDAKQTSEYLIQKQ